MRLSRDAAEALLLLGGFAFVVAVGLVVMLVWPTHLYGNWRLYAALLLAVLVAVPVTLRLRRRYIPDRTDGPR